MEALHSVQPLACYVLVHHSATFITVSVVYVIFFILVMSQIVRLPASFGFLRTPNRAGRRTIQVRIFVVRVPAIGRVKSLSTYPHYRGTPTLWR